jgi:hypothetical protein
MTTNTPKAAQSATSGAGELWRVSPFHLHRRVTSICQKCGLSVSRFGRRVANDPKLVFALREGRMPRPRMMERIISAVTEMEARHG